MDGEENVNPPTATEAEAPASDQNVADQEGSQQRADAEGASGAGENPASSEPNDANADDDAKAGEATQQEVFDFSQDMRMKVMIAHIAEQLENFNEEEQWKDEHFVWLNDYLTDIEQKTIFFWNDFESINLRVSNTAPPKFYDQQINSQDYQVAYFIKKKGMKDIPITAENLEENIYFKSIGMDPLEDLLEKMNNEYVKKLLQENDWPDGVKKDFIAKLHGFMAFLNETTHAARGQTYLYIPDEDLSDIVTAAKDKDLLQRLETNVIYWTRQIKELVSNQDSPTNTAIESPLDEIAYWTKRTANLVVLTQRLQKPELKKIIKVLEHASSSYLPGFLELEQKIRAGSAEAQNNLQFLNTLSDPCRKIESAKPMNIPNLLPEVLNSVRIIWELSQYYNTSERMKGLLTKIGNQIIKRCRAKINKNDMLHGDVEKCMSDLDESINCCKQWKIICESTQKMIIKYSSRKNWDLLEDETIFAENEAFIQRCRDLKEICEGQLQFARKGAKQVMPVFGGTKGPEYTENLLELERMFAKHLQNIKDLEYDILDVKITKWHDDYGQYFKEQCKSLEIMYQNIIALAFKNVSTVSDAVEMLENFDSLAKRPLVKDFVHKRAAEMVYKLFKDEIKEVEEVFEGHDKAGKAPPPMPFSHPQYGGLAIWARSLIKRIDDSKDAMLGLYFIDEHPHAKDAMDAYTKLRAGLDHFIINKCFVDWKNEIKEMDISLNIDSKLEVPVLIRSENNEQELPASINENPLFSRSKGSGLLESNFDCDLHKVMIEVSYWMKIQALGFITIPHPVARLLQRKEQLRILRENVMLIVRDYNTIIIIISDEQKSLFKEHLDILDRTIEPGIRRHNWGSQADNFVYACRKECQDVFLNVKKFQNNVMKINKEFEKISTTTLTNVKKQLYLLPDFIREQEETLKVREQDFVNSFEKISRKVMKTYDLFIHRSTKIQKEWLDFMHRQDKILQTSLRQSVKNTLLELARHISGDKQRQELVPIFRVYTILDPNHHVNWKIIHEPTHDELKCNIQVFMKQIIHVTRVVPRIEKVFRNKRDKKINDIKKELDLSEKSGGNTAAAFAKAGMRPDVNYQNLTDEEKEIQWKARWELPRPCQEKAEYEERIAKHKSITSKQLEIVTGIEKIQTNMEEDRKHWQASEEVRQLYNIRTERGKKRILRGTQGELDQDPVQRYKESIESLIDVMNDVKNKQQQKPEQFIILDCSKLKNSLIEYGTDFIQQIFQHLIKESKEDLNNLLTEFTETIDELRTPPTQLETLKKNKDLYAEVRAKLSILDARREPIKRKFQYIQEQDQDIGLTELSDEDKARLDGLDEAWARFNDGLDESNNVITKCYAQLKTVVDSQIEDFKKECQDNKKNFQSTAPYTVDKNFDNNGKAFEKLQEFKGFTQDLRSSEEQMKFGLEIFDIEPAAYPEVTLVEKEIAQLTEIWEVKNDWDKQWDTWKDIKFYDLNIDDMDNDALDFQDKYRAFDREVRDWGVYVHFKTQIDKFRSTMPLILDLRDDAMRERHWKELRFEVKDDFDETSDDFTLEKVFHLNLLNHQEKIMEMADSAKKQLKIEVGLKDIRYTWEEDPLTDLDIDKQKSKADQEEFYQIRSTDEIMKLIEDHGMKLGNMKSSPYYKEFDVKIDLWEANIAQITETLEILLAVQGKWKYLESIFRGQPDISKQLPHEDSIFKSNNAIFKTEMERINKEKNCLRALIVKNFLPLLLDLNRKFEQIQKNLNQFLEAKRGQFPRFYFLSNEDLLEIIGQSKDPKPIQQHIKKIFEGIDQLSIIPGGGRNAKTYEIDALISAEGERVDLPKQIQVEAKVESWLKKLVTEMRDALRKLFWKYYNEHVNGSKKQYEREKLNKVIKQTQGQILITTAQMQWTTEVTTALIQLETTNNVQALRKCKQIFKKKVESYIELVEKPNQLPVDRLKLVALIIIDEHNREIVESLYTGKVNSPRRFEWLQQLRFRKANDENEKLYIAVDQTNCVFDYGYEYQGNNGRLVITPLTDRAYMTLTNALSMQRGGAPQGPAGTGKTETVKDLGKNLAFFVVIQNCSDQMDTVALGKIFAGLALSGAWGCFDEFNRIQLEVLSVVAQQVQIILEAIRKKESSTPFGELNIQVQKDTGIFITMNPGYAGRSELPDNLACLFRPVAMMTPDFNAIAKITLMSEGFKQNEALAKKVVTIYELMKNQLSKQDHYDFGMRAVKSVLTTAGRIRRDRPDIEEITVAIKAIRDMNLPKFIAEDVILFDNLFIDLFPDCDEPDNDNDDLQIAIEESLMRKNLQLNENLVVKIMQLYESKSTRHGNMLVGATLSGKTSCWQILMDALNQLNAEEKERGVKPTDDKYHQAVKHELINPKSITTDELFGFSDDQNPPQWNDGILSNVLKRICQEKVEQRWMVLDGPVDTLWIESMNSVLDDNKLLTLTNGDRIALSPNVRLLFEVENLAVASPATVSRAGMIYMDLDELGWEPYMAMWIKQKEGQDMRDLLKNLVAKYIPKVLKVKKTQCTELVATSETACVINLCHLFDAECKNLTQIEDEDIDSFNFYVEKWFVFCLIWSIGATVEESSRKAIDEILSDIESMFPNANTVYEYYLNRDKREWASWDEKLQTGLGRPAGTEFHKIIVPTVDTHRNRHIVQALLDHGSQILLVGQSGVGKTVLVDLVLRTLDANTHHFTINFSAGTSSVNTQELIESNFERRAKNKYRPKNAKQKAVCFIDDLNMPRKDTFGSQPPLELMRQWIDYEFWYDRQKIVPNYIQDLQFLSAMGKPGGGRAEISTRILSKFHIINYTEPLQANMCTIFETIGSFKFQVFDEEIKNMAAPLAAATINLFNIVREQFLPTPAKSHYVFNMRDVSKVFQGLYQADPNFYEGKEHILKLWGHEILRVFHDRLNSFEDRDKLKGHLNDQLEFYFQMNYAEHCTTNGSDAIFVDFMNENMQVYEEVTDFPKLREYLSDKLEQYNMQPKLIKMDLVLFKDAITHIAKIYRIINLKRGHAFLVGVGGSGRHSLTRLAAYVSQMNVFQLEVTKGFALKHFREFLKVMYEMAAFRGKDKLKTVFIFSDNDVVQESFLEDIQNMLNGGIVPNLYNVDELAKIREELKRPYKRAGNTVETPDLMNEFFFNNIKDNLHLSICISPIGKAFRNYTRQYPALINNTTINWFMGWPEDALSEVAMKFLSKMEDLGEGVGAGLADLCAYAHRTTTDNAMQMQQELKRIFYVTPTNYIELLKGYAQIITTKRKQVDDQRTKLRNGLSKLDEARVQVEGMSAASEIKRAEVSRQQKVCEDLMINIAKENKAANEQQANIELQTEKIGKEREDALQLAADADAEIKKAEPALEKAQEALEMLDKKFIAEIKSFNKPPDDVAIVMSAVMIVLQQDPTWSNVKKVLADPNFVKKIMEFDKDRISPAILKKIEKYTKQQDFQPAHVVTVSVAAGALCQWVRSLEDYSKALKVVAPKRQKQAYAKEQLKKKEAILDALQNDFKVLTDRLAELQETFDKTNADMAEYKAELDSLQVKIDRGDKLISGLSGEKTRWEATLIELDEQYDFLIGDCILAAAFMSYCGPFPSEYRDSLILSWICRVEQHKIPFTRGFDFAEFMAGAAQARQWQINGLPTDKFSTENGVFVTKGLRWALNIDPQSQAMNWIKKTEGDNLVVADYKDNNHIKKIEQAVIHGRKVLFQDVGEDLDPVLDNILNKSLIQVGRSYCVKVGDKELEYHPDFKLFITTRMSNPHYTPEVSTKVAVVNFTVKESGLEEQCLGIVVKAEQPSLENTKNEVIQKIATSKLTIIELEDKILRMLSESKVNLLEDVALIDTLQSSKETSDEVKQALEQAEITMKKIDDTREMYRACGRQASILFFVLNDLNKIDPMYQFSLDWYKALFIKSIEDSRDQMFQDRIKSITKWHTLQVYKQACRSLFERHKLLLSMQICIKLQVAEGIINEEEWNFFLRGGQVLDRTNQTPKPPFDWITPQAWDHITELEKAIPDPFFGIASAVALNHKDWHRWYLSVKPAPPESAPLPGEWETKCDDKLKKMIVLRCFRTDRVNFAIRNYVEAHMKKEFVENRPTILKDVFEFSSAEEPIIFLLSPGVDPTDSLKKLADEKGTQFEAISMGKGQSERAKRILAEGAEQGNWIFLANCHLSLSLLPELESMIDNLFKHNYSQDFRLILSARPHPNFSISLLQRALKISQEPPKGIKANMLRLYGQQSEFTVVDQDRNFRKAVFGLCWFHTILIERKKFKSLGWNVQYAFNDSDYKVCEDLLAIYMGQQVDGKPRDESYDKRAELPWKAIKYLIAAANYGGRVTDDRDRRLISVYADEIFNPGLIDKERWKPYGTDELNYIYPADEQNAKHADPAQLFTPEYFYDEIAAKMEDVDPPHAYGQHINAEITSQIMDSTELLESILGLTPQKVSGGSQDSTSGQIKLIQDLGERLPELVDVTALKHKLRGDENPLNVVLVQEIQRYNILLRFLKISLVQLEKGIKGLVVISPELEEVLNALAANKVPKAWSFAYFSLKPLANWAEDLRNRYDFFTVWSQKGIPFHFWAGAFTYPTGFTTSLLQRFSRKASGAPIDKLEFDFVPVPKEPHEITEHPKDGAFISGLYLEGAKWNPEKLCLCEPEVMELACPMPVLHFKPIQKRAKAPTNVYECPCYYYPKRDGSVGTDSYQLKVDLKSGEHQPEFWVKRGAALLMSLAN